MIIGDPELSNVGYDVPRLPGARDEARDVAALYPTSTILLGREATKAAFLLGTATADIVHFAGHALGNRLDPASSRLLLAGHDPELTAGDIASNHLRARVVVLGACEGALRSSAGDSPVYGLSQAFLQAGADVVIASQWQAADQSARRLLVEFHRQILTGLQPATALRMAQNQLRDQPKYRHPFYWAGFGVYARTPGELRHERRSS